jgi:antitoxin VapB
MGFTKPFYVNPGKEPDVALNIKNQEVERLAAEVAKMTGETKTEAIRRALGERRQRLWRDMSLAEPAGGAGAGGAPGHGTPSLRGERLHRFFAEEIWALLPAGQRGRRVSRQEREAVLGYGPEGV